MGIFVEKLDRFKGNVMSSKYQAIRAQYVERFHAEPTLFRAPGRINLIGEHTDYNDGFVMPAAIDKETVFAIGESADGTSVIYSVDMDDTFTVDLSKVNPAPATPWVNYLLGVIARLQQAGHTVRPFHCVFGGDIPLGSGLSSSAALECGFIFALNNLFGYGIDPVEMVHMAQWSEHNYAGVKCGIMDQFASMMGKQDHVLQLDCRSLAYEYLPLKLDGYDVLLLDSNVKHSLASSEYNTRRKECEEGVSILQASHEGITNLRDVSPDLIRANKEALPGKVYDRCLYVTEEIERVQAAAQDLRDGNILAFGKKMYDTHHGLSALYEVSCEELDFLVSMTEADDDVVGARMMGGGFGGCTINLVKSSSTDALIARATKAYKDKFNVDLKVYRVAIRNGVEQVVDLPVA